MQPALLPVFRLTAVKIIKLVLIMAIVVLGGFLANHHIFFMPHLSYAYRPGQTPKIVLPENPGAIIRTADRTLPWRLSADAFPFSVTFPRLVDSVRIQANLRNGSQTLVTFTAKGKENIGDMRTMVYASFLENLEWKKVSDGQRTLWMRDQRTVVREVPDPTSTSTKKKVTKVKETKPVRQYTSIGQFLADPPDPAEVASAGVNPMVLTHLADYVPSTTPLKWEHTIRGSHQLYVYAAGETIRLAFDVVDLNWAPGPDNITVRLGRVDQLSDRRNHWLVTRTMRDDGVFKPTKKRSGVRPIVIEYRVDNPGVYFVDIQTTDDIILQHLTSAQHRIALANHLYLAEGPVYAKDQTFSPIQIVTNGSTLKFAPDHEPGKQEVRVAGNKYQLKDTRVDKKTKPLVGETTFTVEKGDLVITTDGLLTMQPASLINGHGMRPLALESIPTVDEYNYVLAEYVPHGNGSEVTIDETYPLSDLLYIKKTLHFSLDLPGLKSGNAQLGLKEIRATFDRGQFPWSKVWNRLTSIGRKK